MFAPASRTTVLLRQRLPHLAPLAPMPRLRRQMSSFMARNLYQIFPATLHYYNPRSVSSLYDSRERGDPTHEMYSEAVYVSKNGLVYPAVGNCLLADPALSVTNGPEFRPNTRWMQEFSRMYSDQNYYDVLEEGGQPEMPYIITVPKGTPVPSHFLLIHEETENFSLQPRGMSINDLNRALDEFFDKYATKETAPDWLRQHPIHTCVDGADEDAWMGK